MIKVVKSSITTVSVICVYKIERCKYDIKNIKHGWGE